MARVGERGLSTAVGYALNITIATLLLSTLLIAGGGLVEDQRERVVRTELAVVGERLAGDLATADRLAQDGSTVRVHSQLPRQVGGVPYRVSIVEPAGTLVLSTSDPAVTVRVPVGNTTDIGSDGAVQGGETTIELDGDELVVTERD